MYGLVKALNFNCKEKLEIYGILEGYTGLINGDYKKMKHEEFEGILNMGGSILGNSRQPFKRINDADENGVTKVQSMIKNYKNMDLDCLVVLGGNGSHKTANLLSEQGLNVVTLPKTIDNDINGTEMTFGFQSAIDIATRTLEELHTTAKSHRRIIIDEIMGNKAGFLTLYSGIAGEADIILIPEIPYSIDKIVGYVSDADILIDTTPVGMSPHVNDEAIVKAEDMHSDLVVNDIVYNPNETVLLSEAIKAGATPVYGIKMLLYQGAESFEIWTGEKAPVDVMEKTLRKTLDL